MHAAPVPSSPTADLIGLPFHVTLARASNLLSLASMQLALFDWALHLSVSPGKQLDLCRSALTQAQQLESYIRNCMTSGPQNVCLCAQLPAHDRRFSADEWRLWPFNMLQQPPLLTEQWRDAATRGMWGVAKHHEDVVAFAARQWLDMMLPGSQMATNPIVLRQTFEQRGANLVRDVLNALDGLERSMSGAPAAGTERFVVGRDVAITPGKAVLRNHLIELIQYAPTTSKVQAEPILIVSAWIMKYYILDLSPENSLIRHLVEQGHTVFCISWKNPDEVDRALDMDDYLKLGVFAALDAVNAIVPDQRVHVVGYYLGGILLTITAAAVAYSGDVRLVSMTLFAAQADFCEPGELGLFIGEVQVSLLEAQMEQTGYLYVSQMAGAFQVLRSYDLLWSRLVGEYLLDDRAPINDLMAWNADATRMSARIHSQYLRHLFLNDDLSEGHYPVNGKPVALSEIDLPIFVVDTLTDHVAPWRSVYKLHHPTEAELTLVLTSDGHNAGIVSPPANSHRKFQSQTRYTGEKSAAPDG